MGDVIDVTNLEDTPIQPHKQRWLIDVMIGDEM